MREEDELFLDDSWGQVMLGQGIDAAELVAARRQRARRGHRAVPDSLIAGSYRAKAETLPTHRQFVAAMVAEAAKTCHDWLRRTRQSLPSSWPLQPRPLARRLSRQPRLDYRARLPQDEVIYFLLPDRFENGDPSNDRGGLAGDRLTTGFDPTAKGFYHGGDLKGLIERLDYIQGLGATARLARADLQEQGGAGAAGPGKRRLSRLLDHRLHAGRSAFWHQRRLQGARRRRASRAA